MRGNSTERTRRYVARNKSLGLCLFCKTPAAEGRSQCAEHLEKNNKKSREFKRIHKIKGLCLFCKKKATAGQYCEKCNDRRSVSAKKTRDKYIENHQCPQCSSNMTEWDLQTYRCNDCYNKYQETRRNRL